MITGPYTNQDGGQHPFAVAAPATLTVDLLRKVNTIKVLVFHDLATATAPPKQPWNLKAIAQKTVILKGVTFTTDPAAIDNYLMTQAPFTGWTEVPPQPAPAVPAKK